MQWFIVWMTSKLQWQCAAVSEYIYILIALLKSKTEILCYIKYIKKHDSEHKSDLKNQKYIKNEHKI